MTIQIPRYGDTKYEVLSAIAAFRSTHAFGPTVDELKDTVGLSVRSSVQWHINDLLALKFVTNIPRKHRTLQLTKRGLRLLEVLAEMDSMEEEGE